MTDFVLQSGFNQKHRRDKYDDLCEYARFLKQPLKLEMFVHCDEDGNILEEPNPKEIYPVPTAEEEIDFLDCLEQYQQAKEKVLFEDIPIAQAKWLVNTFSTIEHLSDIANTISPIYLTENAIKQIGL